MSHRPRGGPRWWRSIKEWFSWLASRPGYYWEATGRWLERFWRKRVMRPGETFVALISWPFTASGNILRRSGRIALDWWRSAGFRYFLQGLPAVCTAIAVGIFALNVRMTPATAALNPYRIQAGEALQQKNYERARICFERLTQLDPTNSEYRFGLVQTLAALNQRDQLEAILEQLAPGDKQGYAKAHLVRARLILGSGKATPETLIQAERHLIRTLQGEPDMIDAHVMLAVLYQQTGRGEKAEQHLKAASKVLPEYNLALARLYESRGRKDEALRLAKESANYFSTQSRANVDNHTARIGWAHALTLLDNYKEAFDILEQGLTMTLNPLYRREMAALLVLWSDKEAAANKPGSQLILLDRALQLDPNVQGVPDRLLKLSNTKDPADAEKARAMMRSMLAQGKSPDLIHMVQGLDAWQRGKTEEARQELEQAYKLNPNAVVVANNLAWTLAHSDPPNLPRALEVIDSVLKQAPNVLRFRDTRGHILARMGRWKEALVDLEAALPALEDKQNSHRMLAKAYAELGNKEMAAEHQRLAETRKP